MDTNIIPIVLMESFGVAFFLLAFMFIKQSRRMGNNLEALRRALNKVPSIGDRPWEPCYSYKLVVGHFLKSRSVVGLLIRSVGPGAVLTTCIIAVSVIIGITLLIIFSSAGYILVIGLMGAAILLETDAI